MEQKVTITAGCGQGQSCSVSIYILPQAGTQEYINTYTANRVEEMRRDGRYNGGDKWQLRG